VHRTPKCCEEGPRPPSQAWREGEGEGEGEGDLTVGGSNSTARSCTGHTRRGIRAEAKSTQIGHSRKTHRNLLGVRVCRFEPLGRILASDTASGEREGGVV
jgi:hypothetical protein